MPQFTVSIPASSANLGPGFDCVGLALDIRNEFTFTYPAPAFRITASGYTQQSIDDPDKNLVISSYLKTVREKNAVPVKFELNSVNRIPFEGGMGSSATAILAGVSAAHHIHAFMGGREAILVDALKIETHPDNLSAALYGGYTISYVREKDTPVVYPVRLRNPPVCYLLHPHATTNTMESRKSLRQEISLRQAVENIARQSITTAAFIDGNYEYLFDSLLDCLHEPYRMPPQMEYPKLKEKLKSPEFYGWAISGSGPSVIIFCRSVTAYMKNSIREHFSRMGVEYDEFFPEIDNQGLRIAH